MLACYKSLRVYLNHYDLPNEDTICMSDWVEEHGFLSVGARIGAIKLAIAGT